MRNLHSAGALALVAMVGVFAQPSSAFDSNHLIVISHDHLVHKAITVYTPDGTQVMEYIPEGLYYQNIPAYIASIPEAGRFAVSCFIEGAGHSHGHSTHDDDDDDDHHHEGGYVAVFDVAPFLRGSVITLAGEVEAGWKPFHIKVTPDRQFCVANDESDDLTLINPWTLAARTFPGGRHHTTLAFSGDAGGYDIYATRYNGADLPGGVDIVDADSGTTRAVLLDLPPLPHTAVSSSLTGHVYIACAGGIAVVGGRGTPEAYQHIRTIPTVAGRTTPDIRISPDGRYLIGNLHVDGQAGSFFYAIDLANDDAMTSCSSVSCKSYAYSPDGRWIVAGDFNRPAGQPHINVHVIDSDPQSAGFMTVAQEWRLEESQVGFQAASFSPDSRTAYLGLTQSDEILVVHTDTLTSSTFACAAAPKWVHVVEARLDAIVSPTPTQTATPTPTPTPMPTSPPEPDTDGDGKPDICETLDPLLLSDPGAGWTSVLLPDSDGDGLLDGQEDPGDCEGVVGVLAMTDPRKGDTDGDGILDGIEVLFLDTDPLDPNDPPDATDSSGDGAPDYFLIALGLDPENPDTDGDGFDDACELLLGSDPLDPDSVPALGDVNDDGVSNNLDAVLLFNYVLSGATAPTRLDRADVRVDAVINNLDAIALFNWTLGNVNTLPVR